MSESTAREVWRAVLGDLQLQLPRPTFETWLKTTEGIAHDDNAFVVEVPNSFAVEWLERRMYHALQKTLRKVSGREFVLQLQVRSAGDFYAVEQPASASDQAASVTVTAQPLFEMRSFNPKYSFDSFVAGPSNQLALALLGPSLNHRASPTTRCISTPAPDWAKPISCKPLARDAPARVCRCST